jgi:hypothetical protein
MSSYSDEPVLVKPTARGSWKRWLAIVLALGLTGAVIYIPYDNARLEELAHDVKRGPRQGALYPLNLDGVAHTLELTWGPGGQFAPVLDPAPAAGTTLRIDCRLGDETLAWNATQGCFGPTTFGGADPYSHYKLSLRLERDGRVLWSDTLRALGIHEGHGHAH